MIQLYGFGMSTQKHPTLPAKVSMKLMTLSCNVLKVLKHGASLHNRTEGLSLSVTNPNKTISLVEN